MLLLYNLPAADQAALPASVQVALHQLDNCSTRASWKRMKRSLEAGRELAETLLGRSVPHHAWQRAIGDRSWQTRRVVEHTLSVHSDQVILSHALVEDIVAALETGWLSSNSTRGVAPHVPPSAFLGASIAQSAAFAGPSSDCPMLLVDFGIDTADKNGHKQVGVLLSVRNCDRGHRTLPILTMPMSSVSTEMETAARQHLLLTVSVLARRLNGTMLRCSGSSFARLQCCGMRADFQWLMLSCGLSQSYLLSNFRGDRVTPDTIIQVAQGTLAQAAASSPANFTDRLPGPVNGMQTSLIRFVSPIPALLNSWFPGCTIFDCIPPDPMHVLRGIYSSMLRSWSAELRARYICAPAVAKVKAAAAALACCSKVRLPDFFLEQEGGGAMMADAVRFMRYLPVILTECSYVAHGTLTREVVSMWASWIFAFSCLYRVVASSYTAADMSGAERASNLDLLKKIRARVTINTMKFHAAQCVMFMPTSPVPMDVFNCALEREMGNFTEAGTETGSVAIASAATFILRRAAQTHKLARVEVQSAAAAEPPVTRFHVGDVDVLFAGVYKTSAAALHTADSSSDSLRGIVRSMRLAPLEISLYAGSLRPGDWLSVVVQAEDDEGCTHANNCSIQLCKLVTARLDPAFSHLPADLQMQHLQLEVVFFKDAGVVDSAAQVGLKRARCVPIPEGCGPFEFAAQHRHCVSVQREHLPGGQARSLLQLTASGLAHPVYATAMPVIPAGTGFVPIGALSTLEEVVRFHPDGTLWWMYMQDFKAEVR